MDRFVLRGVPVFVRRGALLAAVAAGVVAFHVAAQGWSEKPVASTAGEDPPQLEQLAPPAMPSRVDESPLQSAPADEGIAIEPEVIAEILRIREKLQINPLAGSSLEQLSISDDQAGNPQEPPLTPAAPGDEFAASLRKVVGDGPSTLPAPQSLEASASPSLEPPTMLESDPPAPLHTALPYETWSDPAARDPGASLELAATLRAASRGLEDRANDLEDVGEYDRADELRRLAEDLRRQARREATASRQ